MSGMPSKNLEKKDIELYFWSGLAGESVGHVSLYIPDNFLYVSFWPARRVNWTMAFGSVPSKTHTYQEDIEAEEHPPDETINATIELDVSAMEQRWREIQGTKYSLSTNNCSDAVFQVLRAGNDTIFMTTKSFLPRTPQPQPGWSNEDYCVWIRFKLHKFQAHGLKNFIPRFPRGCYIDHEGIWMPRTSHSY